MLCVVATALEERVGIKPYVGGAPNVRLGVSDVLVGAETLLGSCAEVGEANELVLENGTDDWERAPLLSVSVPMAPVLREMLVGVMNTVLEIVEVRCTVVVTSRLVVGGP